MALRTKTKLSWLLNLLNGLTHNIWGSTCSNIGIWILKIQTEYRCRQLHYLYLTYTVYTIFIRFCVSVCLSWDKSLLHLHITNQYLFLFICQHDTIYICTSVRTVSTLAVKDTDFKFLISSEESTVNDVVIGSSRLLLEAITFGS